MRRANIVSGLILAVFGLVTLVWIIPWQIEQGPPDIMSPRLLPQMMMGLITGLSVLLVLENWRAARRGDTPATAAPVTRAEFLALLKFAGIFAVALALYHWVAPLAAGAALVLCTLLVLGERRPLILVAMPVAFLFAIWVLFYKVLGSPIL